MGQPVQRQILACITPGYSPSACGFPIAPYIRREFNLTYSGISAAQRRQYNNQPGKNQQKRPYITSEGSDEDSDKLAERIVLIQ